jgi:hypothetical protein
VKQHLLEQKWVEQDLIGWYRQGTYRVQEEGRFLLLLQVILQLQVVVGADRPHVHIVARAGWRRLQLHIHQLLVREKDWRRAAGNGEEAAPVPLVLAALLLFGEPPQPLLPSILL